MRFAHARPATVTLVAGSVLITATSGFSLAAVMGATSAWAHPSGYAVAADDAAQPPATSRASRSSRRTRRPPRRRRRRRPQRPLPRARQRRRRPRRPRRQRRPIPRLRRHRPRRRPRRPARPQASVREARSAAAARQRQANGRAKLLLDTEQIAEARHVAAAQYLQDRRTAPAKPSPAKASIAPAKPTASSTPSSSPSATASPSPSSSSTPSRLRRRDPDARGDPHHEATADARPSSRRRRQRQRPRPRRLSRLAASRPPLPRIRAQAQPVGQHHRRRPRPPALRPRRKAPPSQSTKRSLLRFRHGDLHTAQRRAVGPERPPGRPLRRDIELRVEQQARGDHSVGGERLDDGRQPARCDRPPAGDPVERGTEVQLRLWQ